MQDILVSVIVVSYNSEKYIIETLESVKDQTYKNIELIISDDNSTDLTIELATRWLEYNDAIFVRTRIIQANKNTGIAPNVNRGISECKGMFIKTIAADDILMLDCLEKNLDYCLKNNVIILFSKVREFKVINGKKEFSDTKVNTGFFDLTPDKQLRKLMKHNRILAPTGFFGASIFNSVGTFDETYPLYEDLPFWIKLSSNGYKHNYMNEVTVLYRKHEGSIQMVTKINIKFFKDRYKFYQDIRKPYFIKNMMFLTIIDYEVDYMHIRGQIKNQRNDITKKKAILLLSPIRVCKIIEKKIRRLIR